MSSSFFVVVVDVFAEDRHSVVVGCCGWVLAAPMLMRGAVLGDILRLSW